MQATDVQMIADRWMLESRRLINWGSYEGYHEFRPSTDHKLPVTLLAGASESGKSTLVDAQISLLYPTGTPFNKASNSGRSERSDYTYLRGMVGVGSHVTVQEHGVDEPEEYHVVGSAEADPARGRISNESPLGRALLGKLVGDKAVVQAPDGDIVFDILAVN